MVGLTEFDKDLKPAPVIAKSWEFQDGGKKIIFQLRDDVQWSDGKKVRAQDFEYSWKRLLNPKTASQYAYILFDIVNAQEYDEGKLKDPATVGVKAENDQTLVVTLRHPASYFLAITTFEVTFPQRQDVFEKFDTRWTEPGNIVTNGPFRLASWKHENQIELSANANYFRGKPAIEKVTMYMVNEKTTAMAMYEQGNLDFVDDHSIAPLDKPRLSKLPGYKLVPQLRGDYYGFAVDRKPFDNPKLRKAFALAIDREVFPKILQGGETPATSWIPPGMLAHNPKIGLAIQSQRSAPLVERSGLSRRQRFAARSFWATTPKTTTNSSPKRCRACGRSNLNVVVKIENQEWKVYLKKLQNDPFVVHRAGWGADYPDPDNFMKLFTSNSGNNHGRWKNAQIRPTARTSGAGIRRRQAHASSTTRRKRLLCRNRRCHRAAFLESRERRS